MITHTFIRVTVALAFLLPAGLFSQLKIGYIESNQIMQEFEEFRDAQAKLEKRQRLLAVEYNTYVDRLDSLQRDFERQRLLLSPEKIREKELELEALFQTTQTFQQEKFGPEGELYQYQAELMAPILDKINAAVAKIGAERAYDYIFDAAASGIVYALPAYDLSADVTAELRRATTRE